MSARLSCIRADFYEDALLFLERSLNHSEADSEVLYYLAICCYEVGHESAACHYAERTLALEPEHEGALALRVLVKVDIS